MTPCGVCGEPRHAGRCVDALKKHIRELQARLDNASNTGHVSLESASNKMLVWNSNGAFDKTAYQREYMRKRRAKHV